MIVCSSVFYNHYKCYLNAMCYTLLFCRYCPILPMSLINGASGIGTGWSTNIPNFNVREVMENVRRLIRDEAPLEMVILTMCILF